MADNISSSSISSDSDDDLASSGHAGASESISSVDLTGDELEDRVMVAGEVQGYQFEPSFNSEGSGNGSGSETSASESDSHSDDPDGVKAKWHEWASRMNITDWCDCGKLCVNSPFPEENACCSEKVPILNKMEEFNADHGGDIVCITKHPGFSSNYLDVWVLQAAYRLYQKKHRVGIDGEINMNMKYRYIAYRQLVAWCWGFLGKENRVPLPACALDVIRKTFPAEGELVGFKYPTLKKK
ncbi:uncharacterized protein LOC135482648 [Lineus longissimus]|uniref:uncharacterized protein LOC135482648 n=1 Tax=Lineus longissimus TaxID=88925 RepID=UPI00315D2C36